MNNKPEWHDLRKWLRDLPFRLGVVGFILFCFGFALMLLAAGLAWVSSSLGITFLAVGLALMSLGVGFISVAADFKSGMGREVVKGSEVIMEKQRGETASKPNLWQRLSMKLRQRERGVDGQIETSQQRQSDKSKEDVILERIDKIDKKIDNLFIKSEQLNTRRALESLSVTAMLSGIGLIAAGDRFTSYGWGLAIAGLVGWFVPFIINSFGWKSGLCLILGFGFVALGLTISAKSVLDAGWWLAVFGMVIVFMVYTVTLVKLQKNVWNKIVKTWKNKQVKTDEKTNRN